MVRERLMSCVMSCVNLKKIFRIWGSPIKSREKRRPFELKERTRVSPWIMDRVKKTSERPNKEVQNYFLESREVTPISIIEFA